MMTKLILLAAALSLATLGVAKVRTNSEVQAPQPTETGVSLAALDQDDAPGAAGPVWLDDLDLATSIAAERGRPMMVVFR